MDATSMVNSVAFGTLHDIANPLRCFNVRMLKDANGDEYDALFLRHMIDHHQAALDMAKLSADRAKHQDIKDMSNVIIDAQEKEIKTMKQWQIDWGYEQSGMPADHGRH